MECKPDCESIIFWHRHHFIIPKKIQNSNRIIERAEQEAKYLLDTAKNQIEKERFDMENEMKDKILDLSLKLNSKIFDKETTNKDFLEKEYDLLTK